MKHTIIYQEIELTVIGDYEQPEPEQGYKGGWSTQVVKHKNGDITALLSEETKEEISEQVLNENY